MNIAPKVVFIYKICGREKVSQLVVATVELFNPHSEGKNNCREKVLLSSQTQKPNKMELKTK